jgi:hypothetical protein
LAERLVRLNTSDEQCINYLFRLLASRNPKESEMKALSGLLQQARTRFRSTTEDAKSLLSLGMSKFDETLDPVEVAAWTQVASTALASDPAILLY